MADQKTTQLTEVTTSPVNTDIVPIIQDVPTTPVTKKITWANIKKFLRPVKSGTFASGSNSYVMSDAEVTADSIIDVYAQTEPVGFWTVESASGQFTINSSKTETSNVVFKYFINNV